MKNKTLLVTGGTGSFGHAVIHKLINSNLKEIRILSRDELKQDEMRRFYKNQKLKFIIGDIREYHSIKYAFKDVDYVFHAAALKQVPTCEFYPLEAVNTNVNGASNVIDACFENNIKKLVLLSTDKSVNPINVMGMTKSIMERLALSKIKMNISRTEIIITRYGNVLGTRGSIIPNILTQIKTNSPVTITDPKMTRFLMNLNEALDLVMYAFNKGSNGDIFVQKSPSTYIKTLVDAVLSIKKMRNYPIKNIGTRHAEKLHEVLISNEEMYRAIETKNYFKIPLDDRTINYDIYTNKGLKTNKKLQEYNSENTNILNLKQTVEVIKKANII